MNLLLPSLLQIDRSMLKYYCKLITSMYMWHRVILFCSLGCHFESFMSGSNFAPVSFNH